MSMDLSDDKLTLVQVMAWCRQATSHYCSQCWPRSLSPYGVTGPQWVNTLGILWSCMKPSIYDKQQYHIMILTWHEIPHINGSVHHCSISIASTPEIPQSRHEIPHINGSVHDCSISIASTPEIPQSWHEIPHINGSVHDSSISIANTPEIPQSRTKPSLLVSITTW